MKNILLIGLFLISACSSTIDRVEAIGEEPPLTKTVNPVAKHGYKPMTWPIPEPILEEKKYSNSLWQQGSRTFFRDQRANRVGDILRVKIKIDDKAKLNNATDRTRDTQEKLAAPKVYGLENKLGLLLPGTATAASLFDIKGKTNNTGDGTIDRKEKIETIISVVITQILPNGNFVISGSQEIRVNYEVREVSIEGVVRPQDINYENIIDSSQVAEARISYGGRGQITDFQQPRWGTQVIDILSPF